MTAFGFVMMILGLALGSLFGHPTEDDYNLPDVVAAHLVWFGTLTASAGLAIWLWENLP